MLARKNVHNSYVNANFGKIPIKFALAFVLVILGFFRLVFSQNSKAQGNVFTHTHAHTLIQLAEKKLKEIYIHISFIFQIRFISAIVLIIVVVVGVLLLLLL